MAGASWRAERRLISTDVAPEAAALPMVLGRIADACRRAHRDPAEVDLVAVSKYASDAQVLALVAAGQRRFGESRMQDALRRIERVNIATGERLEWHLVGHLQTNKVGQAMGRFAVIESLDSRRLADAVSRRAVFSEVAVPVLLEVNVAEDPTKFGFNPADVVRDFEYIAGLPGLDVAGLMTVATQVADPEMARPYFAALRGIRERLDASGTSYPLRHLSMGMSADFEVAISEGATIVRVGTALFGDHPE